MKGFKQLSVFWGCWLCLRVGGKEGGGGVYPMNKAQLQSNDTSGTTRCATAASRWWQRVEWFSRGNRQALLLHACSNCSQHVKHVHK